MIYQLNEALSAFNFKEYYPFNIVDENDLKDNQNGLSLVFSNKSLINTIKVETDAYIFLKDLKLPVIDFNKGLETMGNIEFIYKKVITSFLESTSNYYDHIKDKLKESKEAYLIFTHSLKGISLNLGSNLLYKITINGMKEENYTNSYFIDFYNDSFIRLYDDIKKYLEN